MSRILLVAPSFYNYWRQIEEEIRRKGDSVDTILFPHSFIIRLFELFSLFPSFVANYKIRYFNKKVLHTSNRTFKSIIVIKPSGVPQESMVFLKGLHPNSFYVSYIWDDIAIDKGTLGRLQYFDKNYSFSKHDCDEYGLNFRPMFFNDSIAYQNTIKDIDLFYIASYKKNRFELLKAYLQFAKIHNLKCLFILRCSFFLFLSDYKHYPYFKLFKSKQVKYKEMMRMMCHSRCAIEIPHKGQKGLTTRSIEAIPTHTKIITTNQYIKEYSLYNKDNILVVNEDAPEIDVKWLAKPFTHLPEEVMNFYSLSFFVQELVNK